MKRRTFVHTALAAAAASATTLPSVSGGGEFTGVIKKAMKFANVAEPKLSIEGKSKLLQDLGFDGVELPTSHKAQVREFIKARDSTGLPIHGVINSSAPDLIGAIDFCRAVGGSDILITAPYDKKRPLMESWKER